MCRKILFAFAILVAVTCPAQTCSDIPVIATTYITEGGTYDEVGGNYLVCTSEQATFINPDSVWGDYGTNITIIDPVLSYVFSNGHVEVIGEHEHFVYAVVIAEENILLGDDLGSAAIDLCPDGLTMYSIDLPPGDICSGVTGVRDRSKGAMVVGPNPVRDRLQIIGGGAILGGRITDLQGREVLRAAANTKELDVSALAPGQYVLSVRTPDGTFARAVVKE